MPRSSQPNNIFLEGIAPLEEEAPAKTDASIFSQGIDKVGRYAQNIGAEIVSIPGAFPGIVGLAELGGRAAADATGDVISGRDVDVDWERNAMSSEWREKWDELNAKDITPQRKSELSTDFAQNFDPKTGLNWGLSGAASWYERGTDAISDLSERLGAEEFDRKPGKVPLDEEIVGIVGSAFVGLPRSVIGKLTSTISSTLGRNVAGQFVARVAQTTPGKVVTRAAEIATPVTLPLTYGNIFLNGLAGTVINDAMRTTFGESSLINYGVEAATGEPLTESDTQATNDASKDVLHSMIAGLQTVEPPSSDLETVPWERHHQFGALAGAALGAIGVYGLIRGRRAKSPDFIKGGPGFNENKNLDPLFTGGEKAAVSAGKGVIDSTLPITEAARKAGGRERAHFMDNLLSVFTRASGEVGVSNTRAHGILPTVPWKTESTLRIAADRQALGQEGLDLFNNYVVALDARRYRELAQTKLDGEAFEIWERMQKLALKQNFTDKDGAAMVSLQARLDELDLKIGRASGARMSMSEWSDTRISQIIKQAEQVPEIKALQKRYAKLTDDMIRYRQEMGDIDAKTAAQWRSDAVGQYMPLVNDPYNGSEGARRWLKKVGKALHTRDSDLKGSLNASAGRNFDTDNALNPQRVVNNPIEPLAALDGYVTRVVRSAQANHVRRHFVDMMRMSPATSNSIRRVEFNMGNSRVQSSLTHEQLSAPHIREQVAANPEYLRVHRQGRVEFYEFGDNMLRNSLDFAPYMTVPIVNLSRRLFQQGTTGRLAPWFAPTALLFDTIGAVTKQPGRSFGYVDGALQRISSGKVGLPGDPTVFLEAMTGATRGVAAETMKVWSEWIAKDLSSGSTMFGHMINDIAGGADVVRAFGEKGISRYMRTTSGVLQKEGHFGSTATWLDEPARIGRALGAGNTNPLLRQYTGVLEGIHNGAKIAFFSRNYNQMVRDLGRAPNTKELHQLVKETRALAGDMTKAGDNALVNTTTSAVPYSNIVLQSTSHLMGAAFNVRNPKHALMTHIGIFNYAALMPLAGATLISVANDDVRDWYYNKLPAHERVGTIPIVSPEAFLDKPREEWTKEDFILIPMAPELIALKEMFMSLHDSFFPVRAGEASVRGQEQDFTEAAASVLPLIAPPILSAPTAAFGYRLDLQGLATGDPIFREQQALKTAGANADNIAPNSDIPKNYAEALTALFGTVMRFGVNTMHDTEYAIDNYSSFGEGVDMTLNNTAFDVKRRIPIAKSAVWGISTPSSLTNPSDNMYRTLKELEPVFGQFDVEVIGAKGDPAGMRRGLARQAGARVEPYRIVHPTENFSDVNQLRNMVIAMQTLFDQNQTIGALRDEMNDLAGARELIRADRGMRAETRNDRLLEIEQQRQDRAALISTYMDTTYATVREQFGLPADYTVQDFTREVRQSLGIRR